ncbi:MAG: DUF924 family protein [Geminicoccaceae bacterium]
MASGKPPSDPAHLPILTAPSAKPEEAPRDVREILDFWFHENARARWFASTSAFDQEIRRRFGELYARAATGALKEWERSAEGCLALCILLDQFPRNIFRGDARAFATDHKALAIAERAVAEGFDRRLPAERKQFLYMPFMHSENLGNQLRAIALLEAARLDEGRRWARDHLNLIRRFGRFPHRNAVLGRPSTPDELAFLEYSEERFGQAPAKPEAREP